MFVFVQGALEPRHSKVYHSVLIIEINPFPNKPLFLSVCSHLNTLGKGIYALEEQFLLFPKCFLPFGRAFCIFNKFEIVFCKLSLWKSLKSVVCKSVKCLFVLYDLFRICKCQAVYTVFLYGLPSMLLYRTILLVGSKQNFIDNQWKTIF